MSTENLKSNQFHNAVHGSEISDYIEKSLDNFSATETNKGYWSLYNKDNPGDDGDQVKAVLGICFTLTVLFILGTYTCLF